MSSSSKQKVVEVKTRKHGARLEPLRGNLRGIRPPLAVSVSHG